MRRFVAFVTIATAVVVLAVPGIGAAEQRPVGALRAERTGLLRRIAHVTDELARLQERAVDAGERQAQAVAATEEARRDVAAEMVAAYMDGVGVDQTEQLLRKRFAETASKDERFGLVTLQAAEAEVEEERRAAEAAALDAAQAAAELKVLRDQLERTITERETADRAAAEARRLATRAAGTGTVRTTRSQSGLFSRFPFGAVRGVPAGLVATGQVVAGRASWYGPGFDGRRTASGAVFDQEAPTVAHKTLPLGTILLVSRGGRHVLALVNDRGPFGAGRVLDLSYGVATALGTVSSGVAQVTAQVLVPSS